jgi:hypothetical protein
MRTREPAGGPVQIAVLMPVRDDWTSAAELIRRLDRTFDSHNYLLTVVLVNDGSVQSWVRNDFQHSFTAVRSIRIVNLKRNVGHQRAIAIGLTFVFEFVPCDGLLVMDADGEDTPDGALQLLLAFSATGSAKAVFAERSRRSESLVFRTSYVVYRTLHFILTGLAVRVGNFCIVPASYLTTLTVTSELWNHYAAAVFQARLPFSLVPIPRGHRIAGESKMNFVALVTHGLSAISVFGDRVGVRILIASLVGTFLAFIGICSVLWVRFFTDLAIPGWATYVFGTLSIILIQLITIASSFTFFMLSNRTNLGFMPFRDCPLFIEDSVEVYRYV